MAATTRMFAPSFEWFQGSLEWLLQDWYCAPMRNERVFQTYPIASNTNESFEEAEEHAEPVDARFPAYPVP